MKYGIEGRDNDSDDEDNDDHDYDGVYLENKVDLHHVDYGGMSSFEPVISIVDEDPEEDVFQIWGQEWKTRRRALVAFR